MKGELTDIEKQSLEQLGIFSMEEIEYLANFEIHSVGGMLGATKGLVNTAIFDKIAEKEKKIKDLYALIPGEIIEKYRGFNEKHETGWLGRPE
jgi:hypothetical protein